MADRKLKAGVIGYGTSAKVFHIPFIVASPHFVLHAIVQRSMTNQDDARVNFADIKVYRSVEDFLEDREVDVVVVATGPESHFTLTKLALEAGKHVVVEKPFVPTSAEADQLIALAKRHQRVLTVYQNRRWDADFLTVLEILDQRMLGNIAEWESHFDMYMPNLLGTSENEDPPPGSGVLYGLGVHLIDQVVFALGMPQSVTGIGGWKGAKPASKTETSCTILLQYETGLLVTLKGNVVSTETEQLRFWIRGDGGSYKKHYLDIQEDQLVSGRKPSDGSFGVDPESRYGAIVSVIGGKLVRRSFPTCKPPTYGEFYNLLARSIFGQGDVPVKATDARNVIRIIELAIKSCNEGRKLSL
ncbi:NAD binding Rossmann fold oxidoreductase [Lipomyces doorenjongii]